MTRSILLAGPRFSRQAGGLARARAELVAGLRNRGFDVEDATGASVAPEVVGIADAPRASLLGRLNRSAAAAALWSRLSPGRRRALRDLMASRAEIGEAVDLLSDLERRLRARAFDAVLYCVEEAPPGGLALAQTLHPRVVPMAIDGLAAELRGGRLSGRLLRARGAHPWLGRRANPRAISSAILSSRAWAAATERAGLPGHVVHAVYFGVPLPASVRAPRRFTGRLLYVGRLVKEKGVYQLLAGVAAARERDPRLTLTLVCGEGPLSYRSLVERRAAALGLGDAVLWRTPVPRSALPALFAEHDALLFWSPVDEPAPLVTMEAMAARLPVVMPAPRTPSPIHEDGVTCVTYDAFDTASIADAILRLAADPNLAERIATGGAARIRDRFTPEHTAREFAALLDAAIAR